MASGILARLLVGLQTFSAFARGVRLTLRAFAHPKSSMPHRTEDGAAHRLDLRMVLAQASLRIQQSLDTDEVFDAIADELARLGYRAVMGSIDQDRWQVRYFGFETGQVGSMMASLGLDSRDPAIGEWLDGLFDDLSRCNRAVFVDSPFKLALEILPSLDRSRLQRTLRTLGIKRAMIAPLQVEETPIGLLVLLGRGLRPHDVPSVEVFAAHTAIAIDHARRYKIAQQEIVDRVCTEQALRDCDLRFWRMANTAPIMIWMSDPEGGCTYFNKPWLDFRGRTLEEEFGDGWSEGVHPDDLETCLQIYHSAIETQTPFEMEYRLQRADGSYRWILDKSTPRFRSDGSFGGLVGACTDVTPLKRAETALRESEHRFRALYNGITDALFVHKVQDDGLVSHFLEVNDVACQRMGYTREELLAMTPADIDDPRSGVDTVGLSSRVAAGEDITFEQVHVAKDGSHVPVEIHAKSFELGGQPAVISIVRDITERKEAESQREKALTALRESEERFQKLFERAPIAYQSLDEEGRIIAVNQAWLDLLGYTKSQVVGRVFTEVLPPEERQRFDRCFDHFKSMGEIHNVEYTIRRRDGSVVIVSFDGKVAFDQQGNFHQTHCTMQDITLRKRAQEALRRSEARFRALVESSSDHIFILDRDGEYLFSNNQVIHFGLNAGSSLLGHQISDVYPPEVAGFYREQLARVVESGRSVSFEHPLADSEGARVHMDTLYPVYLEGELWAVGGICRDVTDLKQAEAQAAREAERAEALLRVADRLSDYFTLEELLDAVCEESRQALSLSGSAVLMHRPESKDFTLAKFSGLSDSYATALQPPAYESFCQLMADEIFIISDATANSQLVNYDLYVEYGVRTIVGTRIVYKDELLGCLVVYTTDEPRTFSPNELALLRGIADQAAQGIVSARLFDQLRSSQQRLEDLSKRLVRAQEVERRHLARELHDDIGQVLTMIKLNLRSIDRKALERETIESLDASLVAVDDAIQRVRHLSRDLRPSVLDDLGLVPALRWFIDQQAQQAPFEATFSADVFEDRLPSNLENTYFRIVQEAMTNVMRHAQAETVSVELHEEDGALVLSIWDDGVGFDVERTLLDVAEGRSLGLLNMRERALLIGGSFDMRSEPGEGTEVTVRTPLGLSSE